MNAHTFWLCFCYAQRKECAKAALVYAALHCCAVVAGNTTHAIELLDIGDRLAVSAFTWDANISRACGA